jgi:rhodanese-related sulfurtransferase
LGCFVTEIESLDKTKNYYVYCRSGMKCKSLRNHEWIGFENAYNLVGGILEWEGEVVTP